MEVILDLDLDFHRPLPMHLDLGLEPQRLEDFMDVARGQQPGHTSVRPKGLKGLARPKDPKRVRPQPAVPRGLRNFTKCLTLSPAMSIAMLLMGFVSIHLSQNHRP